VSDADAGVAQHLKTGVFGTLYYGIFAGVYASIITQSPESFILHADATTPPLAPQLVVPALVMFGIATLIAVEAHGNTGENTNVAA